MNRYSRLLAVLALPVAVLLVNGTPAAHGQSHSLDAGATYTYVRTNLLPRCNCFGTNGGSGQVQFNFSRHLSLLGDVTVTHAGSVTASHYDLTQTNFTAGVRYFPMADRSKSRLFGDVQLGGAHASGSLSPGRTHYGSATTFAFQTGGGVQYPLTRRWTLIPAQAEYLLTTFGNGANNRQNDLRVSAGVLFRLHR